MITLGDFARHLLELHQQHQADCFAAVARVTGKWWDELNAFWCGERRYVGEGLQQELGEEA